MISEFRGRWTKFSNYSLISIWYGGHIYPSVEHAYQAAKAIDPAMQQLIRNAPTPNAAKKLGRHVNLRLDWDQIKLQVMEELLRQKFAQEPEQTILISSMPHELIEGNWWGDTFWGQCPLGNGENHLGKLLMKLRDELFTGKFGE